jgi:hypothetical protein
VAPTEAAVITTIAINEGTVAADSQLTGGNHAVRCQKVFRLPDGGVAAGAGLWPAAYAGISWLVNGERGEPPSIEDADIYIVRPDGSIWIANGQWPAYPILDRSYAAGCGADLARMLLSQGLDPVSAVAQACELDAMSSGPILSMTVIPPTDQEPQTFTVHHVKAAPSKRKRK